MSTMKLTLIGLETYLHQNEQSLFDELVLPGGINKEDVTNNILLSAGEFEALYADPYFLRSAIGLWGRKHYRTFDKWVTALNLEYNPLENYDRIENWNDASNRNTENTQTLDTQNTLILDTTNERTLDTQDVETRAISDQTTYDKDTTTKNDVSAYDSGAYQPSEKSVVNEDGTVTVDGTGTDAFDHTGTDTMSNTGTETTTNTGAINTEGGEDAFSEHSGRVHGNIGVTTSQQMLQSELDIARFNLIEQITDLFVTEFCLMVYD